VIDARPTAPAPRARRLRPFPWPALASAALLAGYADLARGGTTLAPLLLVLGYCVLVPVAVLRS
jgi:hypothetical protein